MGTTVEFADAASLLAEVVPEGTELGHDTIDAGHLGLVLSSDIAYVIEGTPEHLNKVAGRISAEIAAATGDEAYRCIEVSTKELGTEELAALLPGEGTDGKPTASRLRVGPMVVTAVRSAEGPELFVRIRSGYWGEGWRTRFPGMARVHDHAAANGFTMFMLSPGGCRLPHRRQGEV